MQTDTLGDRLHRSIKLALDSGEVTSIEQAEQLFARYCLVLEVGADVAHSPTLQATVLTAVNTGRRCFLGGVFVQGKTDVELSIPWQGCRTLGEAILDLQGKISKEMDPLLPRVIIGDAHPQTSGGPFAIRATFNGWSAGVTPFTGGGRLPEHDEFTPSGVLAGALAVSEAFQFVRGSNAMAGRRDVGLSLWRPEGKVPWLEGVESGPSLDILPARLWLIGLGHLGQAYLWTLGLLPYRNPEDVQLVLQDYDVLLKANDSTSLLTSGPLLGEQKTRAMAAWSEKRGFRTTIQERRFGNNFRVDDDEPRIALCGVDNAHARAQMEKVGFERIIEAGLGWGPQEYLAFQVHTFPARRSAQTLWGEGYDLQQRTLGLVHQPAYQHLAADGLDQCGLTMLAGRSVGASFVGAATAAVVIAELLRMTLGEHRYEIIDGTLRSLLHRQVIRSEETLPPFNPGYTKAIGNFGGRF